MKTLLVVCALMLSLATTTAFAAEDMRLTNSVQKVETFVNDSGEAETRLVGTDSVVPGDELRYTVTFANVGARVVDADSIVITNPVPDNTQYIEGSAFGAGTRIVFSVDGGENYAVPDALTVTDEDGSVRVAEPREYTHIRWTFEPDLEPGQEGSVFFRVTLL